MNFNFEREPQHWWEDKQYEIDQIDNTDRSVTTLCARNVNNEWEYAIVVWQYRIPYLRRLFKNGAISFNESD